MRPSRDATPPPAGTAPPRPGIAWRVGVTGSRTLAPDTIEALRAATTRVLALVHAEITALARSDAAAAVYDTTRPVACRLLSPLAEGADRLVAESALAAGYTLEAPLPFPRSQYEADFPASAGVFRALLGKAARMIELDGARGDDADLAYENVGRYVVRNTDLLVALWDGQPARGRGGTGDIVRFALRAGVPVWWLSSNGQDPPRLLRTELEMREPWHAAAGPAAEQALKALLRGAILPPPPAELEAESRIGRIVDACAALCRRQPDALRDYLAEDDRPGWKIWQSYNRFMDWIAPPPPDDGAQMLPPIGAVEAYWHTLYTPADRRSQAHGDRYRSSYLGIVVLAFVAVVCAVLGLAHPAIALPVTLVEWLVLMAIAALVIGNHLMRWHERWIAYRLLSELCRKQQALAPFGWSLPNWEIDRLAAESAIDPHAEAAPREAWVAWYFTAARRAAPLPEGAVTAASLARARGLGLSLMREQLGYHERRRIRSRRAARRLGELGKVYFIVTLIGVTLKIGLLLTIEDRMVEGLVGLVCAVIPALSAAFVGLRAYAEFELLAHQSARMAAAMKAAMAELDAVRLDRPLASQELGTTLYATAVTMLQDIAGWAQLFRMKIVEAG